MTSEILPNTWQICFWFATETIVHLREKCENLYLILVTACISFFIFFTFFVSLVTLVCIFFSNQRAWHLAKTFKTFH